MTAIIRNNTGRRKFRGWPIGSRASRDWRLLPASDRHVVRLYPRSRRTPVHRYGDRYIVRLYTLGERFVADVGASRPRDILQRARSGLRRIVECRDDAAIERGPPGEVGHRVTLGQPQSRGVAHTALGPMGALPWARTPPGHRCCRPQLSGAWCPRALTLSSPTTCPRLTMTAWSWRFTVGPM